jgi:hypothetical protein
MMRFRFVLASTPDGNDPIVDWPDMTADSITVSNLGPGRDHRTVLAEQFESRCSTTRVKQYAHSRSPDDALCDIQ